MYRRLFWTFVLFSGQLIGAEGGRPSLEQLKGIIEQARRDQPDEYHFANDGCFLRADHIARLLAKANIPKSIVRKVVLDYPDDARWNYHIAVAVKANDGKFYVLDPIASPDPIRPKAWRKRFAGDQSGYRMSANYANRFSDVPTNRVNPYDPDSVSSERWRAARRYVDDHITRSRSGSAHE